MSTLVLHAHPLEESYSAALRGAVCDGLDASSIDFSLFRLAEGQQPSVDDLAASKHLVAVYPTWWGGIPAMLLDWLQQLLGPVVDGGPDGRAEATSPLALVEKISVVTTHGSSTLMNNLQGQPGKQTWTRVVLPHCAPDAQFEWVALYKIDRSTDAERADFLAQVESHFTNR